MGSAISASGDPGTSRTSRQKIDFGGTQTNAAAQSFPLIDLPAALSAARTSPAPRFNEVGNATRLSRIDRGVVALTQIDSLLSRSAATDNTVWGNGSMLDNHRSVLADGGGGSFPPDGGEENVSSLLALELALQTDESGQFLSRKFNELSSMFGPITGPTSTAAVASLVAGNIEIGAFDALFDDGTVPDITAGRPFLTTYTSHINYDRLGSSHFQGLVYTNGFLHTGNDISIIGALVARDDGSQASAIIDGETLNPGDLYLAGGTKVTFVKDFFDGTDGPPLPTSGGGMRILTWMSR